MIVLNFHRIESPTGVEITRLSPLRFSGVLDEVERVGNEPVQITFDDGFASIAENGLPELQRRGHSSIVFLISGAMGGADAWDVRILGRSRPMMTWAIARQWAVQGVIFGSHTCSHRDLTALSPQSLREEIVSSRNEIEDRLGARVKQLSYPFGRHNQRVRDAAQDAGYECAYAMRGMIGERFAIPRVNVHSLMTTFELRRILNGGAPSWRTGLFASLSTGTATVGNWRYIRGVKVQESVDARRSPGDLHNLT